MLPKVTPDELSALQHPECLAWLRDHADADPVAVAMNSKLDPALPRRALAEQLRCRRKAAIKLPTWVEHDCLFTPRAMEQCSHHAVARYRAGLLEGSVWDLAAGLGVDAWAAAAAGHAVTVCEFDPVLVALLMHNAQALGVDWKILGGDGPTQVAGHEHQVSTCLIDPDRRTGEKRKIQLADCRPDLTQWWPRLRNAGVPQLFAKVAPACPAEEVQQLPGCRSLRWISHHAECRELLIEADRQDHPAPLHIATGVHTDGSVIFEVSGAPRPLPATTIEAGPFIIEPDPAIIRASLVGNFAIEHNLSGLHPAVALLTGDHAPTTATARSWQVIAQGIYQPKTIKRDLKEYRIQHLTIHSRHFPYQPDVIAKQLKVKTGGGQHRLLCWRDPNDKLRYALGVRPGESL